MKSRFFLLFTFVIFNMSLSSQVVSSFEFNNSNQLTESFYNDGSISTYPRHEATGGLNNSGFVRMNDDAGSVDVDEVFISKQGYSNAGVGSVFEFSMYFKSVGVGYGGLGFQIPEGNGSLNTTAQGKYARSLGRVLGISFHGNGYHWHKGSFSSSIDNTNIYWDATGYAGTDGVPNTGDAAATGVTEEYSWLKAVLKIENTSLNNYRMTISIYKAKPDGSVGELNETETTTYTSSDFQNADILHSYFAIGGKRVSHIDRYSVLLSGGSSFIEPGLPIVTGSATRSGTTISLNGNVTNDRGANVTERGFVWSRTEANPTLSDTKISSGTGEGVFTGSITGVTPGAYYIRAFATNSSGTSYGQTSEFIVRGAGNLNIIASGGTNEGTTWDLSSGYIVSLGSEDANINASVIETALAAGDLTILTDGYINIESDFSWTTDAELTLQSAGNIFFGSEISATHADASLNIFYGGSDASTAASNGFDYIFNLANDARIEMTGANASLKIANESYTIINDISEIATIPVSSAERVALTDDIDVSATNYTAAVVTSVFQGVFEGLGNEVQNMTIRNSGGSQINLGFFSEARGATIRNFGVTHMDIFTSSTSNSTEYRIGGIVGSIGQASLSSGHSKTVYTTTLDGVWSSGKIATANTDPITTANDTDKQAIFFAGGLVGNINNGTGIIKRSFSTADVSSAGSEISRRLSVGGLIGDVGNYDTSGNSTTVKLIIERSYATGSILTAHHSSGYYGTGGLVGVVYVLDSNISNSYSWSNVVSQDVSFGGITGFSSGGTFNSLYTTLNTLGNIETRVTRSSTYTGVTPTSGTTLPSGFSTTYWSKVDGQLPRLKELQYPRTALYVKVNNGTGPLGNISPTYSIVDASGTAVDLSTLGLTAPSGEPQFTVDNNTPAGTYRDVAYLGGLTLNGSNRALYILRPYSQFATYVISATAPNITSFSPTTAEIGSNITLTGTNLSTVNAVTVAGVTATFTVNSATSITVTIPVGATSGSITVSTATSGQSSKSGFILATYNTLQVSDITINEGSDWGVFEVNGPVGDVFSLRLLQASGEADLGNAPAIQWWNGSAWVDYITDDQLTIPNGGTVYVRVDITGEQDTIFEGAETFGLEVFEIPNDLVGLMIYDANFQTFNLDSYTVTGTDGAVGTTYKKVNAITIDGQAIDIVISIDAKSNVSSFTFDNNTNASRFEPQINSSSSSGSYVDFTFEFFLSGTTTKVGVKNFVVNPVDIDGSSSTVKEFVELFGLSSYQLGQNSGLTVTPNPSGRTGFTRFEGINSSLSGIEFENTASFIAYFTRPVDKFKARMGVTGSSSSARLFSSSIGSALGTFGQPSDNTVTEISGTATIIDDGTGDYWIGDNPLPATSSELVDANITLDDDQVRDINSNGITVASISDLVYNGTAQSPSPEVKDGDTTLVEDTDYELSYAANTNVGTATITLTGKGNYNGTRVVTFNITRAPLTITADAKTKEFGEDDPELTVSYTGFVNGEDAEDLTGTLAI
ncbi:MBG domain-containing protein, partial [Polaribacter marinaquae]|uniref:MBG domain-containing protein n=1 Tax=Polaribacter marinaquae TaxID=1642819 RepID=UPI003632D6BD